MENIHEIERILINTSEETLEREYNKTQERERRLSRKSTINFFKNSNFSLPNVKLSPEDKLSLLFRLILETKNQDTIALFKSALAAASYHHSTELLMALHDIDDYSLENITYQELEDKIRATTINGIRQKYNTFTIQSTFGDFDISNPFKVLNIKEIPAIFRQKLCHSITNHMLFRFPELYGAYYRIPCYFEGYIDHSVIIDFEKGIVYDFANGASLPLAIWQKYMEEPEFTILGNEFNQIYEKVLNESEKRISLAEIDYARKRIK